MADLLPPLLLGWAGGLTVMTLASYRRVSPYWLRGLLLLGGLGLIVRDLGLTMRWSDGAPEAFFGMNSWFPLVTLGLTFPSIVAVDQLIRHPAMTPIKLLRWCLPLFLLSAVASFGNWGLFGAVIQLLFAIGFAAVSVLFILKIPIRSLRIALAGLACGHLLLGVTAIVGFWPLLYPEMLLLLALWYAYETSAKLR